jgi:hypothetical protein
MRALALFLIALCIVAPAAATPRQPAAHPWRVTNVIDAREGANYIAIHTGRKNALATGRLLATRGTWRDVRRLFNASFTMDARASVTPRRLGQLILRAAKRGRFVVYRSENGGYPFAPFAPEASRVRP